MYSSNIIKKPIPAVVLTTVVAACAQRPIQITAPCQTKSAKEIIANLSALMAAEGMQITLANEQVGVLQASTAEERDPWTGMYTTKAWSLVVKDGTVQAYAKTINQSRNAFGVVVATNETYYSDKVHQDWMWYWNVRRGLQELCGTDVTFIER